MSIIGAIGVGLTLGKGVSDLLFKYTQQAYLDKIEDLNAVIGRLNTHLTNLTNMRNEIPSFWNDEEGKSALAAIDVNIEKVTIQLGTAKDMVVLLRQTVDALEGGKAGLGEKIQDAKGLLDILEL